MTAAAVTTDLGARLDRLETDVAYIVTELRDQQTRRRTWDELRRDLAPIGTEAMLIAGRELEQLQDHASTEDLLRLVKRLARNTRNIEATLQRLESAIDFLNEAGPIATEAMPKAIAALAELDERGYFTFARSGFGVVDRVVTSFTEDDVNQLGDNIVLILQTVKEMTQPEVMELLQRTAHSLEEEVHTTPSARELLRQMRDPQVKRGLARMLRVLGSIADQPQPTRSDNQEA